MQSHSNRNRFCAEKEEDFFNLTKLDFYVFLGPLARLGSNADLNLKGLAKAICVY